MLNKIRLLLFENVRIKRLGVCSPVVRFIPDEKSGDAASTGFKIKVYAAM